eukprot:3712436-Pleurochrysis_carterae.AAC.1
MVLTSGVLSGADVAPGGPRCRLQLSKYKISSTWSSKQQAPATLRASECEADCTLMISRYQAYVTVGCELGGGVTRFLWSN